MIKNKVSSQENWKNWKWQNKNSIKTIEDFEDISGISFSVKEKEQLQNTARCFPLRITPYYASLIDYENYENDPIFRQCFPSVNEMTMTSADIEDPLSEDIDSPVKYITHRYPDRILFHISNKCAMYCRHCTRKRKVGDTDIIPAKKDILRGLEYIKETPAVRDVLLSGGDPLMLPDDYLDWILSEIQKIPHVEIVRIGTRIPVVLPYRITEKLASILKKYKSLWINTHFNHPRELSKAAIEALNKLSEAGIPLGNQSVLLAGVNDCVHIMKKLVRKLVQNRVRPYYLYQCDLSSGLSHFRTPISKGIEIIEGLRGHTSGLAVPTFVVDAPGGGGKIPLMPQYLLSTSPNKVILRNYEGIITAYEEPQNYEHKSCDLNCKDCALYLKMDINTMAQPIGIKKLLADFDDAISLVPLGTERMEKRHKENEIIHLGSAIVQHGHHNDRVYLMTLGDEDPAAVVEHLELLAQSQGYTKIFAKISATAKAVFENNGYSYEACVPALYHGKEDGYFFVKYFSEERKILHDKEILDDLVQQCLAKSGVRPQENALPAEFMLTMGLPPNASQLAELYKEVFESYPFPIHQAAYLESTMETGTEYFCVWNNATLVAAASLEPNFRDSYAEMSDFAVLPAFRDNNLSKILLEAMEHSAAQHHIQTVFSIARAASWGMNSCFARRGYAFGGTLVNNTNICNSLESMNVWYKALHSNADLSSKAAIAAC